MSHRSFIIALACMLLAVAGFVIWTLSGSTELEEAGQAQRGRTPERVSVSDQGVVREDRPRDASNRFTRLSDGSVRWQVRVDQLRRLDASTLNATEVDYLYGLLRHAPSGNPEAWWVVVNEVMEQIVKQSIAPERITGSLAGLIGDQSLDPVLRDYAIQHLSIHLKEESEAEAQGFEAIRAAIVAPENQHNSIPGTALVALSTLQEAQPTMVHAQFTALESYLDPLIRGEVAASVATRTSAINAVALVGAESYLPAVRTLAQAEGGNDSVRLSAIAALGDFHQAAAMAAPSSLSADADRQLLEALVASNTKFKFAAQAALKKLQH
ncbi:hypothetical protein [Rubritalea tangerina]|uniref:HEAT repeat domain-containing protein n=1 Tax=Rubritalea tangerina TaxID=430798 RepID=A0ABW4ZD08_9BACT